MTKHFLFAGVAALAITSYASPAIAQDASDEEEARQDTIVVTARKTEESLQEAPVAVSVVSSDQIENLAVQDLSDISKLTAGLLFDNEFGRDSNRPVIRGQANILGASGVSYFIDGVRISGAITDYNLNDVAQIEIVKGPQSALYGRNTYSGAINITTKAPSDVLSANASIEVGDFDHFVVSGGISGPITDTLSGSFSGRFYEMKDPFTNAFDGNPIGAEETFSLSGALYWEPTDQWDIRLRGYHSESDDGQAALFATDPADNNCFTDNGALYGGNGRYFCGTVEPRDVNTDYVNQVGPDAGTTIENTQISLNVDYDINDNWSVASVFGYNEREVNQQTDGDYKPTSFQAANFVPGGFPFIIGSFVPFQATYAYPASIIDFTFANQSLEEELSQEFRLEYEGDNYRAMVGVFHLDREDRGRDTRVLPADAQDVADANFAAELASQQIICGFNPTCTGIIPLGSSTIEVLDGDTTLDTENNAIFALVDFDLTETVSLTLEGRYAEEKINRSGANVSDRSQNFDSFAPRATLSWQATPSNLLYGVYAQGQKPGGFNSDLADSLGFGTFEEEEIVNGFELGSKNVLLDGQLTANFAAFFNEIEGYQLTQNVADENNTSSAAVNAGDAEIMGLEAEFLYAPDFFPGLTATLNYAYTDSEFTSGFDQNEGVLLDAADDGLVNCSTGFQFPDIGGTCSTTNNPPLFGSIVGRKIPRTAENMAFFDLDYRGDGFSPDWEWFAGANVSYESSKYSQVHNQAETGDATLVSARIGVTKGPFTVRLWGKNLTDEDSTPLVLRFADAENSLQRNFVGTLRRPRQVGVTLSAAF
ncbi:MAG: TonB-dependent receptor [Henriciella sp.]